MEVWADRKKKWRGRKKGGNFRPSSSFHKCGRMSECCAKIKYLFFPPALPRLRGGIRSRVRENTKSFPNICETVSCTKCPCRASVAGKGAQAIKNLSRGKLTDRSLYFPFLPPLLVEKKGKKNVEMSVGNTQRRFLFLCPGAKKDFFSFPKELCSFLRKNRLSPTYESSKEGQMGRAPILTPPKTNHRICFSTPGPKTSFPSLPRYVAPRPLTLTREREKETCFLDAQGAYIRRRGRGSPDYDLIPHNTRKTWQFSRLGQR